MRALIRTLIDGWFGILCLLLVIAHLAFGISLWHLMWPCGLIVILTLIDAYGHPALRALLWPWMKNHMILKVQSRAGALVAYPMIIWLECSGKEPYLNGGLRGLHSAMRDHIDTIGRRLEDTFKEAK